MDTVENQTTETTAAETNPLELEKEESGVDWAEVSQEEESEEDDSFLGGEAEEGSGVEEGAAEVATEPAPATETAAPIAPVAPASPTVPIAPAAPVEPAPVVTKKALTVEEFKAEEARLFGEIEKLYGLSEEEAQGFLTEPELVLPKTAARLHMNITKDVIGGVQSILPGLIQQYMHNNSAEQNARSAFQAANPDLMKPEYEQYIFKVGKLFRDVNPDAPADVAIKQIGDMVRQALNLPNPASANQGQMPQQAPAQVAPAPRPFSPARGGSGGAPVKEANPWADLAGDRDETFL